MSSAHVLIRRAVPDDVERIVRLINAGGPTGKPHLELPYVLPDAYHQTFETIDADPHQHLMVAQIDGLVVGTFHLTFLTYLAAAGRSDALVEVVHVAASHRRQGIGTTMPLWVIEEAKRRDCRRVQLTTDKRRTEAHVLYERLGFRFTHEGAKLPL